MGIVRLAIELDNASKIYWNGSVISGKVYLDLDSPKTVKGIKLNVHGEGSISWSQTRFALEMKDVYPAEFIRKVYIDDDNFLLEKDGSTVLPEGQHVYPFSYKLPETIPPSFEEEYGKIEYHVKVTIQRAWYLWNHRTTEPFTVVVPFDLNSDHRAAQAVHQQISHTLMGCQKPVDVSVSLPVRGYIPGQVIPITIDINNGAEVKIKSIYIMLVKVNIYHGKSKTRREEDILTDYETPMQNETNLQTRIQHFLKVPPLESFCLKYANLIDIEFIVRVEVRVGGLHKNFDIDVPIIIGSVALLAATVAMAHGTLPQENNGVPVQN